MVNKEESVPLVQETSIKKMVVGPLDVRLQASAVHRILKMVTCAMDHEYEPYCKPQTGQTHHSLILIIYWYPGLDYVSLFKDNIIAEYSSMIFLVVYGKLRTHPPLLYFI